MRCIEDTENLHLVSVLVLRNIKVLVLRLRLVVDLTEN